MKYLLMGVARQPKGPGAAPIKHRFVNGFLKLFIFLKITKKIEGKAPKKGKSPNKC